jgi:hypothetical protein
VNNCQEEKTKKLYWHIEARLVNFSAGRTIRRIFPYPIRSEKPLVIRRLRGYGGRYASDKTPNLIVASAVLFLGVTFVAAQIAIEELRDRHGTLRTTNPERQCKISTAASKQTNTTRHDHCGARDDIKLIDPATATFL